MAIPEFTKRMLQSKLAAFCEARVPKMYRDQVRLGFEIRSSKTEIFEERPRFDDPSTWGRMRIAQIRYDSASGEWSLYCLDRNDRLHRYELEATGDLDVLLDEVDRDPTGIFWG